MIATEMHDVDARRDLAAGAPASRQVNWFETFRYASRIAAQHGVVLEHGALPIAGTQQWCGLPDDDARKLLALVLGGVREALSNEIHQDAITAAGEDIWEAADWSAESRKFLRRRAIDEIRKAS